MALDPRGKFVRYADHLAALSALDPKGGEVWRSVLLECETDRQRLLGDGFLGDAVSERVKLALAVKPAAPSPEGGALREAVAAGVDAAWHETSCQDWSQLDAGNYGNREAAIKRALAALAPPSPESCETCGGTRKVVYHDGKGGVEVCPKCNPLNSLRPNPACHKEKP